MTGLTGQAPPVPAPRETWRMSEDWLAVCLGGLTIAAVLAGARITLPSFSWAAAPDLTTRVLTVPNLTNLAAAGVLLGVLAAAGLLIMRESIGRFAVAFPAVYVIACVALLIAGNSEVSAWGLEYVIFAFGLGLVVSNTVGVPSWLTGGIRTEYYIKVGLVILGASIVFGDLLRSGALGMAQALLVVLAVWIFCFRLAKRLRVDDEFATMMATAVSICGVSAAIAACGAIQGDRKKLSYVTSLVLIVAAPMMVAMPHLVRLLGLPDAVGGAWLGGTLDTSGSVVAAGEMISETARDVAVVVKLSQNVLIGVAAFALTIWWSLRSRDGRQERPGARVIWDRFPKFVLGFLAASFVLSFLVEPVLVTETRGLLNGLRTLWFALAFTSIGLETRFSDLLRDGGGRPALAFIGGQAFNVVWTLLLAYLLFGGSLFASLQAQETPRSFDVVSIKPRVVQAPIGGGGNAPDRFERPDTDLMLLIRYAYDLFPFQVVGAPDWVTSKRWEVSAKASGPVNTAAMRTLVRRMLEDRFGLRAHQETRELPIYELVMLRSDRRLGPKIKPAAVDCTPFLSGQRPMQESPREPDSGFPLCSVGASIGGGLLTPRLNGQPLTGLIRNLEASLQRRVVDKTGLQGNYDIELTYVDERLLSQVPGAERPADSAGASLFTALQEQLGMKLESSRGPVEVLVIDSVSEPTTN